MLVTPRLPIGLILFRYLRRYVLLFIGTALLALFTIRGLGWTWLALSTTPLTIVGIALSIFLGFRTNAAYERYWEGRKLWGRMVNVSRHFTHQSVAYLGPQTAHGLIHAQALYVHAFRCHCRQQAILADPHVRRMSTDQRREDFNAESNIPAAILSQHHTALAQANRDQRISDEQLRSFDVSLHEMLNIQGGCERILKTPLPASYVYFARQITIIFGAVLPFGLASQMGVECLIIAPLVGITFLLIDTTGRLIENPFSLNPYGLPLTTISLTIERNIRDRIGENETPPAPPLGGLMENVQY